MKSLQKVENVISDSSQKGHLLIWGHFPAKNGCQSLTFKFPAKANLFLHVNFYQLARPESSPGIWPTAKIGVQKYLNPTQISHFEASGVSDQESSFLT